MIRNVVTIAILALGFLPSLAGADTKFSYYGKKYSIEYREEANQQLLIYGGRILPLDGTKHLKKALSMLVPGKNIVLAVGQSYGGETAVYENVGKKMREACPAGKCTITTYVHTACMSACTNLYLYGDQRIAHPLAVFGFHREWIGLPSVMITTESKKDVRNALLRRGISEEWLDDNLQALLSNQKYGVYAKTESLVRAQFVHRSDWVFAYAERFGLEDVWYRDVLPQGASWLNEYYERP